MTAAAEIEPGARLAAADGGRLAYHAAGAGIGVIAPLCFGATLAGLEASLGQRSFLNALGAGHELVVYDQRGAGESHDCPAAQSWDQRGRDLWAVAEAAGIERAVLYGVFDAGFTVVHAALQQPERVLGLIFNRVPPAIGVPAGEPGVPDAAAQSWFGDSGLSPRERALAALQGIGVVGADATALAGAWAQAAPPDGDLRLLRHADLRPRLPKLPARALVIEPQRPAAIAGWGTALAGQLPNARLIHPGRAGEMLGAMHGFLALIDIDEGRYASRLAAELSSAVGQTERSVAALRRIVVPVSDEISSERAAEMACRLGEPQQAEVVLIHVVEVPLTQALGERDGPERARAEKALRLGEAIVARHGLRSRTRLLFERSAAAGIVRAAAQESADLIVMAWSEKSRLAPAEMSPTMREVLRRAPCEVLIDQAAEARA